MRTQLNNGSQTPGMQHMIILHSPRHEKDATEPPAILTQRESKGLANHHELKQFIEAAKAQNEQIKAHKMFLFSELDSVDSGSKHRELFD